MSGYLLGPVTAHAVGRMVAKGNGRYQASAVTPAPAEAAPPVEMIGFVTTAASVTTPTYMTVAANVTIIGDNPSVAVNDPITVKIFAPHGVQSGSRGTAIKVGEEWFGVVENRACPIFIFTSTTNSHDWTASDGYRGGTVSQNAITGTAFEWVGQYPAAYAPATFPTITNPLNLHWRTGDRIVAMLDADTLFSGPTYIVVSVVPAIATRFRFVLTANAPNGLTPNLTVTAINPVGSDGGPPPTGTFTVRDIYGVALNAKTGMKGIAEWDFNNGYYYATECEHNAWRFHGTLASPGLSAGDVNIVVNPFRALDGRLPSGAVTVRNTFSWDDGEAGHIIACEWNPIDGRYEAYQMRCPN